jgi:hypothetical protein
MARRRTEGAAFTLDLGMLEAAEGSFALTDGSPLEGWLGDTGESSELFDSEFAIVASSFVSTAISTAPTGSISPTSAPRTVTVPERGVGISTIDLSVSIIATI